LLAVLTLTFDEGNLKSKSSLPKSTFPDVKKTYKHHREQSFSSFVSVSLEIERGCIFLLLLFELRKERSDEQTGSGRCSVARFVIALAKFHAKVSYESTFEYTGLSEVGRVTRVQSGRDVPGEQTAPEMPPPKDQSQRAAPCPD
jgi:hypothetical protein